MMSYKLNTHTHTHRETTSLQNGENRKSDDQNQMDPRTVMQQDNGHM